MEIDSMLLAPLDMAHERGIATPTLDLLAALVERKAQALGLYRTS